jgi:hypothetical protein
MSRRRRGRPLAARVWPLVAFVGRAGRPHVPPAQRRMRSTLIDNGITRRSFPAAAAGVLGMAAANVRPGEQVRLEAEEVRLKADTTPVYRIGLTRGSREDRGSLTPI